LEVVEKRTRKLSSCQISSVLIRGIASAIHHGGIETAKQLLFDLGPQPQQSTANLTEMINWRTEKERIDQVESLKITIESAKRTAQFSSIESTDKLELPSALHEVTIEGGSTWQGYYYCRLRFNVRDPTLSSEYTLQGRDSHTINGVARTLDELLDESETKHYFAYRNAYTILISSALNFLAWWAILRAFTIVTRTQITTPLSLLAAVLTLTSFWIVWFPVERLLQWSFPYFSYTEDKENKRRGLIRGAFYTLVIGLILQLVYDLLIHPLISS